MSDSAPPIKLGEQLAEFQPSSNPFRRIFFEHPRGFWFIFGGELAERASYYGMRTILALYMVEALKFPENQGAMIMQIFIAFCYLSTLLGGWVADNKLGRYKTILYYSVPYVLGHVVLGFFPTKTALFVALALLALGSGTIKPNTTPLMGMMYEQQGKKSLLTEAFSLFYAAINIGALTTSWLLPVVRNHYGYGVAFLVPAVLMVVAFGAFAFGKRFYPKEDVRARPPKTPEQKAAEKMTAQRVGGIFFLIAVFWLVYDQNASTWIYFANKYCDLRALPPMHLGSWSWDGTMSADQVQALNPLFIIFLTPVFNWIWGRWKKIRGGREVPDTTKMSVGFFIVIGCMLTMTVAAFLAKPDSRISIWWEIIATFVITLAELCISVVGLEFAYNEAAPGTKSFVTAAFLLTVTVGDSYGGLMNAFYDVQLKPPLYFALQTVLITIAAALFIGVARRFMKERRRLDAANAASAT